MNSHQFSGQDSKTFLLTIVIMMFLFCLVVLLDIPVARQIIGFLYLTFVPGFIFLRLLRLEGLSDVETILFSVGISVAFLMIVGLLLNEIGLMIGFSNPLTLMPLVIIVNCMIVAASILASIRNTNFSFSVTQSRKVIAVVLFLVSIPVLSIVGSLSVNYFNNNVVLLFLMIAISLVFGIGVMSKRLLSSEFYVIAIFAIAISLLYHSLLISNYVVSLGSDAATELSIFKNTQDNAYWGSTEFYPRFSSMLSITILPTLYSNLLSIDPTWTFKILYPFIFSFVPLGLYQVWRRYIGDKYALIAAFVLMAEQTFYFEMVALNRQMIAELFFVLLLLVILNQKMKQQTKMSCFIIFSFGLVVSHYGLSEIFLFFISLTFILLFFSRRPSRSITVSMVVLFFVITFSWYIYTLRSAVFDDILGYSGYVFNQLGDFFNPASRGEIVLRGLGMASSPTILNTVSRAFAYLTYFLIVFGFVGLVTKRTKFNIERSYFTLISLAVAFLCALVLVPGFAKTLNMTRFYHILLFFLAPLSVIGAKFISNLLPRQKEELRVSILLVIVLVPYFLFQTNFVYEVTGSDSWSVPLSKYRMSSSRLYGELGYIDGYSVVGAQWLSKTMDVGHTQIFADLASQRNVLNAYGVIHMKDVKILSNVTRISTNDTVYLSALNIVEGIIIG